jgi:hypothetical protein
MKRLLVFSLLIYGLNLSLVGQTSEVVFSTFQKSNFGGLTDYLAKEVDLCLINDQSFSSRAKTVERLTAFFSNSPIVSVEPIHQGAAKNKSSSYYVGKVVTKSGKKYKLFVYQEIIGGKTQIAELRIENFND